MTTLAMLLTSLLCVLQAGAPSRTPDAASTSSQTPGAGAGAPAADPHRSSTGQQSPGPSSPAPGPGPRASNARTQAPNASTQAPGTQAPGTQALGTQALGTQALGTQAPGTQTLTPPPADRATSSSDAAPAIEPEPMIEPEPVIEPYRGSLAAGLAEIERLSDAGDVEAASTVADALLAPSSFLRWRARTIAEPGWRQSLVTAADPLLDALGLHALPREHRAAIEYARGVVLARADERAPSEAAFLAARELAGPGTLRLDAVFNAGTSALLEGEAERAKIPEIQGQPPQVPPAAGAGPGTIPGGAAEPPPDPLALARVAYLRAREHLVERVRSDWRDEDVRANLELVLRRLKELDEIEKKREEEKQKQEQEKQDEQEKKDEQSQDKKDEQEKKDEEKKDDPEKKPDDEGKQDPKDEPEEKQPEEPPEDPKEPEKKPEPKEPEAEQELTKEEMTQLLDRLKELEEQARRLQEQLQRARRVKVKKDW